MWGRRGHDVVKPAGMRCLSAGGAAIGADASVLISVNSVGGVASEKSSEPAISADGRFIAFHSRATDLIADDINPAQDVFRRDVMGPPSSAGAVIMPLLPLLLDP